MPKCCICGKDISGMALYDEDYDRYLCSKECRECLDGDVYQDTATPCRDIYPVEIEED